METLWVDGRSVLVAAGRIATKQLWNVALFVTARDWANIIN